MTDIERILNQLPCPIKSMICIGKLTIVLVDDDKVHGSGDITLNRNIFAFRSNGSLLWQIQEAPDGGNEWPKPYISLKLDGDKVMACNWIGTNYLLNMDNGTVCFNGHPRRPW